MSERDAIARVVEILVDAVNNGEFGKVIAAFSAAPTIVEDIAPFIWQGPDSPSAWLAAMGANAAQLEVRAIVMKLGAPLNIKIAGEVAYAVFPGSLSLAKANGELFANGILTFTLQKGGESWLIETLVWSGPEPTLA